MLVVNHFCPAALLNICSWQPQHLLSQETARKHYCGILTHTSALFVFNYMEDDLYNRGLTGLAHCINYYPSDEVFTPHEMITSLKVWYNKMVSSWFYLGLTKCYVTLFVHGRYDVMTVVTSTMGSLTCRRHQMCTHVLQQRKNPLGHGTDCCPVLLCS